MPMLFRYWSTPLESPVPYCVRKFLMSLLMVSFRTQLNFVGSSSEKLSSACVRGGGLGVIPNTPPKALPRKLPAKEPNGPNMLPAMPPTVPSMLGWTPSLLPMKFDPRLARLPYPPPPPKPPPPNGSIMTASPRSSRSVHHSGRCSQSFWYSTSPRRSWPPLSRRQGCSQARSLGPVRPVRLAGQPHTDSLYWPRQVQQGDSLPCR